MSSPTVFIGVVSHEFSRFSVNQGVDGLAERLAQAFRDRGSSSDVVINTANYWDEKLQAAGINDPWLIEINDAAVQRSLSEQLRLEFRWASFLRTPFGFRNWVRPLMLGLGRLRRVAKPPHPSSLRRLLNIELSHVDLWQRGLRSGAPWILILEDDAFVDALDDLVEGLDRFMREANAVAFVNLSESFGHKALHIGHLLKPHSSLEWDGRFPRIFETSERPVTNTVCAILYQRDFLGQLLTMWSEMPVDPIVPIDWKLNQALMLMHAEGHFADGACGASLCVTPAPIVQGSMRSIGNT